MKGVRPFPPDTPAEESMLEGVARLLGNLGYPVELTGIKGGGQKLVVTDCQPHRKVRKPKKSKAKPGGESEDSQE